MGKEGSTIYAYAQSVYPRKKIINTSLNFIYLFINYNS